MSEEPLHKNQVCNRLDLRDSDVTALCKPGKINIKWLMDLYKAYPHKEKLSDSSQSKAMGVIECLFGNDEFRQQSIAGVSEEEIRKSWEPGLSNYKVMRKKSAVPVT